MSRCVVVLGAGRMGVQIGIEYAIAGFEVNLIARNLTALMKRFSDARELWNQFLPAQAEHLEGALERIAMTTNKDMHDLGDPEIIVESLPEDLKTKVEALRALVAGSPSAIVATNTSSLSITDIGELLGTPTRVIGIHYLNPPYLNPLVEVIPGDQTSSGTLEHMLALLEKLNKTPILVRHPLPGFVWNRLQFALLREALNIVNEGVVSAEDVDKVMEQGLGRRWQAIGPLKSVLLGGVGTFMSAAPPILQSLGSDEHLDSLSEALQSFAIEPEQLAWVRDARLARDTHVFAPEPEQPR